jgi:hypothetical protein
MTLRTSLLCLAALVVMAAEARAQTMTQVLTFLLTNRSIVTDDFTRDTEAALTTGQTIGQMLQLELGAVPLASSASGFTYRFNPSLGVPERTSDSFGPFFVNRSLTLGDRQVAISVAYRETAYERLDGRSLVDGTLRATASQLRAESTPFDVETLRLELQSRSTSVSVNLGVTDNLDVGFTIPFLQLSLSGERVDIYRGARAVQATAAAASSGIGDTLVRAKFNIWRKGGTGLAVGVDGRLPTGSTEELLGTGHSAIRPRAIASAETGRVAVHGDAGYQFDEVSRELNFGGAVTVAATPILTLVGEMTGRRIDALGRLIETVQPHPTVSGVDTWRLTASNDSVGQLRATFGLKWNVHSTWLLSAHVTRTVTDIGLTAGWMPTIALDYSLGR